MADAMKVCRADPAATACQIATSEKVPNSGLVYVYKLPTAKLGTQSQQGSTYFFGTLCTQR